MRILINVVMFQTGWLACVLGAGYGWPSLGPIVVLGLLGLHLLLAAGRRRQALVILIAGATGSVLDTVLGLLGALSFPVGWGIAWLAPLWMTALWMNFATTLNLALGWLNGRYRLAVLTGAVGGTMAYAAGERLGALALNGVLGLAGVAFEWALAMPVLLWVNAHTGVWYPRRGGYRGIRKG